MPLSLRIALLYSWQLLLVWSLFCLNWYSSPCHLLISIGTVSFSPSLYFSSVYVFIFKVDFLYTTWRQLVLVFLSLLTVCLLSGVFRSWQCKAVIEMYQCLPCLLFLSVPCSCALFCILLSSTLGLPFLVLIKHFIWFHFLPFLHFITDNPSLISDNNILLHSTGI